MSDCLPYAVVDCEPYGAGRPVEFGTQLPVLGRFRDEGLASAFIATLTECETGRYGIDGPPSKVEMGLL